MFAVPGAAPLDAALAHWVHRAAKHVRQLRLHIRPIKQLGWASARSVLSQPFIALAGIILHK